MHTIHPSPENSVIEHFSTNWKEHLNDEARADLPHIRALFESRDWTSLVPDQAHKVVTVGYGSSNGYVAAASTGDGATVSAYFPSQKKIIVDMSAIAGTKANAFWFNPCDGSSQQLGTYPTTGSLQFTPPTDNDWVLLLDNASLNLTAPGTTNDR